MMHNTEELLLGGPWKQSTFTLQLLLEALLRAEYLWSASEYIIFGSVFHKKWEKFARETPRGGPEASASHASPQTHDWVFTW